MQQTNFENIAVGAVVAGAPLSISRASIRAFAEASLDFNPLHLDDNYMQGDFGKTNFDGIIMHGMTNFGLITRMMTDWALSAGAIHRRLETRWLQPVKPGDTITPQATVVRKLKTIKSQWLTFAVEVKNASGEVVAQGEALAELPLDAAADITHAVHPA